MWLLYIVSTALFLVPLLIVLLYAGLIYLCIAAPLRVLSKLCERESKRKMYDSRGIIRYRGYGWKVGIYARNIALSLPDQGLNVLIGGAPDVSLSEQAGLAKMIHENGDGYVSPFVLNFGKFVDWIFWNKLWQIEENHIENSLDPGERYYNTLNHWHHIDSLTNSRDVAKYIKQQGEKSAT